MPLVAPGLRVGDLCYGFSPISGRLFLNQYSLRCWLTLSAFPNADACLIKCINKIYCKCATDHDFNSLNGVNYIPQPFKIVIRLRNRILHIFHISVWCQVQNTPTDASVWYSPEYGWIYTGRFCYNQSFVVE